MYVYDPHTHTRAPPGSVEVERPPSAMTASGRGPSWSIYVSVLGLPSAGAVHTATYSPVSGQRATPPDVRVAHAGQAVQLLARFQREADAARDRGVAGKALHEGLKDVLPTVVWKAVKCYVSALREESAPTQPKPQPGARPPRARSGRLSPSAYPLPQQVQMAPAFQAGQVYAPGPHVQQYAPGFPMPQMAYPAAAAPTRPTCEICRKPGHTQATCYQLYPHLRQGGRGANNS